jgi:hypothetical protein
MQTEELPGVFRLQNSNHPTTDAVDRYNRTDDHSSTENGSDWRRDPDFFQN